MHKRMYSSIKKSYRKDGSVTLTPEREWKWVKNNWPQKKQPKGNPKTIWSKRFGYIENYSEKERESLKCPSGYNVGQSLYCLRKLWWGYKKSLNEHEIKNMEKYARKIQQVEDDIGLKTSSFPHLGFYGDRLIFLDHKSKTGEIALEVDHSHLKEIQELEELKEQLSDMYVPPLIEPDIEKGEELVTIADEIPAPQPQQPKHRYRVEHSNRMHFGKKRDEEWVCEICDETIPPNKNHICKHKEEENLLIFTDDIPFESFREN